MVFIYNILCLLVLSAWTHSEPTTSRYSYNSSDISYLSNGIQFPVPSSESLENVADNRSSNEEYPEMRWLAQLYDHFKWGDSNVQVVHSEKCKSDMLTYIDHLHNSTSWAIKMFDASGRYMGQFLFGNDYWVGSKSLCDELANVNGDHELPPFPIHFIVAKIRININQHITPVGKRMETRNQTRQLNVGQCLPRSCSVSDVRLMLAQERSQGTTINIVGVRTVPGEYTLWSDKKFYIIVGTSAIVFGIILVATVIDIINRFRNKRNSSDAEVQNNNNNFGGSKPSVNGSREMVLTGDDAKKNSLHNNFFMKFLLCFSALTNGRKILNVDRQSKDSITCIHGLRFCSILWIILVHTYLELFAVADNKNMRIVTERTFMYQTIANATFSVDTFFFISGLLVTITYFRNSDKAKKPTKIATKCEVMQKSVSKFALLVIYRFFRLTPAYMFVLGVNELSLRYIHNYSVFTPAIIDHVTCDKYWWRNALYVNNFFPQSEYCMLWSWYMANDTQFYVITAMLLLIAVRGEKCVKIAGGIIGVFMATSWVVTFVIAMRYQYVVRVEEPFALFDQLYDKPWLRIGPYLIGIMSGYFLYRVKCKMTLNPIVVVTGWVLALSCLAALVYGVGRDGLETPASAFYASLGHTAWGLSLAWITMACCFGYGEPFDTLFSCRLVAPLSRLSFCAYLIHPVLMCLSSFAVDGPVHLSQLLLIVIYCGNVVVSFLSAFFISLMFEAPAVNLLKLIF